jgi:predicted alpha/beta superfamily hydrolase
MIKILKPLFILSACFFLPVSATTMVEETISIGKVNRISLESKVLGDTRDLIIHLPNNYTKSNQSYPVLYLIDGNRHIEHAIVSTNLLQSQKRIPEQIIVAVSNNDEMHHDPDMALSKFTDFVKNEVMSYVNSKYKTSGLNTLYGHTKAGWFTAEVLANQPELFRNYIIASAPLQDDESKIYNKILANGVKQNSQVKSLYIAVSKEADEPRLYTEAFNKFVNFLLENPPRNLDWRSEHLIKQVHMTTSVPSLYNGLTHVFNNYQAPSFANLKEYLDFGGFKGLENYYNKRAKIYDIKPQIAENTLLNAANMLLSEREYKRALDLYLTVILDYPESAAAHSGAGQAYYSLKQYDKSILAHQTAVKLANKLNPTWQQDLFQSRLDKVEIEINN